MQHIVFSSQLSAFSVSAGNSPASVSVKDSSGDVIFRNEYNTELGFKITGLSKIINRDLRSKSASSGDYTITVSRPGQPAADNPQPTTVIYNEFWKDLSRDAEDFLLRNFLLEIDEITVPAGIAMDIPIEIWTKQPENCHITQVWTEQGVEKTAVIDYPVAPGGDTITVYAGFARLHAPMAVLLECGQRRAVVKFTAGDNGPDTRVFTFRNMFNATETVWLTGVLSESPSAERTVAEIDGVRKVLDIVHKTTYTLSVQSLPLRQALRARRMLYSRETSISHLLTPGNPLPIDIDDISGNIHDNRSELCNLTIKFSILTDNC